MMYYSIQSAHMTHRLLFSSFFCLAASLFPNLNLWGQCNIKVTHTSGTQIVGCTQVTVTSSGSASTHGLICGNAPYFIANSASQGSYTFNFNPAISGVKVGLSAVNHGNGGPEEVSFYVNSAFYPISAPGPANPFCGPQVVITPTGTVQGCINCGPCYGDIIINENMTSLTVENILLSGIRTGVIFSLWLCCPTCPTDAGIIIDFLHEACINAPVNIVPASQTNLDNDDLLQYILFSNLGDTLGSIITTSNNPSFSFDPVNMQVGVLYYVAAIVGNNVGGNVDIYDPCLDISNGIPVIWRPVPTVTFAVAKPDVCAGACTTVTATFTGTAPFTLTYSTSAAGPVTETFTGNTGTFQVCTAAGSPPGNLTVQATKVVDGWCICE